MFPEEFLKDRQQGELFQRRGFERIVKLRARSLEIARLQHGNKLLRSAMAAIGGLGKTLKLLVSPGGGDPKTWMDQQERRMAQGREGVEGLNLLTASGRQS